MSKLPLVDWVSDSGRQIFHAVKIKHAAPAYVESVLAELADDTSSKTATAKLGSGYVDPNDYAIVAPKPMFPCNSKCATWMSAAYYMEQRNNVPADIQHKVERHLMKAASFWQITDDIQKIIETEADLMVKQASYDTSIPLRNDAEVKAAAEWLCRHDINLTASQGVDQVVKMASDILDVAEKRDVMLSQSQTDKLGKLACTAGCYNGRKVASVIRGIPVADEDVSTRNAIADVAEDMFGDELQSLHYKMATVLEPMCIDRNRNVIVDLAPDRDVSVVKLANGAVIDPSSIVDFTEADWAFVGKVSEDSLSGAPADLESLNYEQASRLTNLVSNKTAGLIYAPSRRSPVLVA